MRVSLPSDPADPGIHPLPSQPDDLNPDEIRHLLASDGLALREIVAGLHRVETEVQWAQENFSTLPRGYFTPDEDDRVRRMLLAYRGYRVACYEIMDRWRGYASIQDLHLRVEAFVTGYGTALLLSSKTLALVQSFEGEPLIRAKINEPDPKLEVPAGFFEELVDGYSSPANLMVLSRAHLHWSRWRREIKRLVQERPEDYEWLVAMVRLQQRTVRKRLWSVIWARVRFDLRTFLRLLWKPFARTRGGLQSLLAGTFAEKGSDVPRTFDKALISRLKPLLRSGDLLLVRAEGKLTTALLPGFWAHAALYFGGREDLEKLGIQGHDFVKRHQQRIPDDSGPFGHVIEAKSPRVGIHPLEQCLTAEHVAILRPRISESERAGALAEAFGHLDKPYDFEFDFNVASRIVCTELIYRALHGRGGIAFDLVKRLGRYTLTGDDLVDQILSRILDPQFEPVALVLTDSAGVPRFVVPEEIPETLTLLRTGWRPTRDPWPAEAHCV